MPSEWSNRHGATAGVGGVAGENDDRNERKGRLCGSLPGQKSLSYSHKSQQNEEEWSVMLHTPRSQPEHSGNGGAVAQNQGDLPIPYRCGDPAIGTLRHHARRAE